MLFLSQILVTNMAGTSPGEIVAVVDADWATIEAFLRVNA